MIILLFVWRSAANLLMWHKSKILYDISLVPKPFVIYWPTKCQLFIYYSTEMQKGSLWKTSKWNARLIYSINKNNSKSNNKNQARITKAFEKTLLSETILSIITKIFLLYTLRDIASFNFFKFCWFVQSINTLKIKVSASKGCCFCFLLLPNLLNVSSLYLSLHCNKCF